MDEEAENDNAPKLLKLSSPRNPGGSTGNFLFSLFILFANS